MKVMLLYRINIIICQLIYSTNTSRVSVLCTVLSVRDTGTTKTDRFFAFRSLHLSGDR